MATLELKEKIINEIDKMSDEVLVSLYDYINSFSKVPTEKINLSHNLSKILNEDKNLLERLSK